MQAKIPDQCIAENLGVKGCHEGKAPLVYSQEDLFEVYRHRKNKDDTKGETTCEETEVKHVEQHVEYQGKNRRIQR